MVLMDCIRPVIDIVPCISTIIDIVTSLWSCFIPHANYLCKLQENGDSLNKALNELKNERDDVQQRVDDAEANPNEPMKRTYEVNGWLQSVTAIESEVLEILRQVDQQTSRRCLGGYCPDCCSDYMLGRSIVQYIESLDELRKREGFKEVAYKLPPPSVQEEPTSTIVGMKSMFENVWSSLAKDEVRIMGLYGKGGVGKTTLLKEINNAFLNSTTSSSSSSSSLHGFDVVILVVVSETLNINKIQMEIGKRLGLSSTEADHTSIFNVLTKKSFVLLLDDIWHRVDLQSIGVPPPSENNKSKVVFTTRSEVVCGLMEANEIFKVECLPWNEAWSLFEGKVGERALKSFPRARELAEVVARECGGLPLALITIGRAMAAKKNLHEWNDAITTLQKYASKFPGMDKEVLPILKVSYDNLGDDMVKSCFLYCALFPEDYSLDNANLIDYWIGEGLISLNEFDHIDEARNHGYDVIGNLKGASLLESGGGHSIKKSKLIDYWIGEEGFISLISDEFDHIDDARNKEYGVIGELKGASLLESGGDEETEVKMHDTIRDLALWIAHECGNKRDKMFIIKTSDLTPERSSSSSWYNNAERIYLIPSPEDGETKVPPSPLKSPNLITLIFEGFLYVLPQNFFEFTPLLRVLDLSNTHMETFPMSITKLLELRYLSLSETDIEELPEELGKLVKLNFLDLSHMSSLRTIPSGVIGSLLELRVLNLFESHPVYWDFDELYKLKHLNDLGGITLNTEHLTKLLSSSNKNLQMCTRHLCIDDSLLFFYQQSEDYKPQSTSLSSSIITIEKLQLLFNLETLQLHNLDSSCFQYLGSSCFQNLIQIEIESCNGLKDLTWVGYVPNLKTLRVSFCEELEEIIIVVTADLGGSKEVGGGNELIFKGLKTLEMRWLPKLKSICRNALAFPCLESMHVLKCPQLKKLPLDSGSNPNNTLRKIRGGPKWWSGLQWEEEKHHNNNNNNNNNELLKSKFLPYLDERSFDDESSESSDND